MKPWLTVVGIGEDGLDGLSAHARRVVEDAEVLVGGARHLSKVPDGKAERLDWEGGMTEGIKRLEKHRGRRVVVLASGDPMHFGVGSNLVRWFEPEELIVLPRVGAFSLAAARMGWSLNRTDCLTVHARPLALIVRHLAPGKRLLILSRDGGSPAKVAELLAAEGYGPSAMTVLGNMEGENESRIESTAEAWDHDRASDLNVVCVECRAGPDARVLSRAPGLPDDAFEHDGLITKREVRAATLARLMPLAGQVLWDVGAGSGSVAIEWLRAEPHSEAYAVERDAARAATIRRNADALGVPHLDIVEGAAPDALEDLPDPDAVFVGGGASAPGLLEACWKRLKPGGRLVANAVTLEAEARLLAFLAGHGGELVRVAVSRAAPVGGMTAFRPLKPVTQLAVRKD